MLNGGTIKSTGTSVDANPDHAERPRGYNAHMVAWKVFPTISVPTTPANGHTYGIGEQITVQMLPFANFDSYNLDGLSITMLLGDGSEDRANRRSAQRFGRNDIRLRYTVQEGDIDEDGVSFARDALENYGADRHIRAIGKQNGLYNGCNEPVAAQPNDKVDGIRPIPVRTVISADGESIAITFSETLSSTTAATTDFAVTAAGASRTVNSVTASGNHGHPRPGLRHHQRTVGGHELYGPHIRRGRQRHPGRSRQ